MHPHSLESRDGFRIFRTNLADQHFTRDFLCVFHNRFLHCMMIFVFPNQQDLALGRVLSIGH